YQNQIVTERVLISSFMAETNKHHEPITLIIHADKTVSYKTLVDLALLARQCGITNELLATLPSVENAKP
ncbi:MAG TPA: biopolymer transporter ExbD, partial [Verrucomicrobiae bacterium]